MIKKLHIYVEGYYDCLFIKNVFDKQLLNICEEYIVIEYSKKKDEKIKSYINTIKKVDEWDYVYVLDQDGKKDKKEKILKKYKFLDENKVFVSIYEIESWIIAGITNKIIRDYEIKFKYTDTSIIYKEKFDLIKPNKLDKMEFVSLLLENYNINNAIKRNASLAKFHKYLTILENN